MPERYGRENSAVTKAAIKRLIIADPGMPAEEILDALGRKARKGTALPSKFLVDSIRSDTRETLKLLKELGFLHRSIRI